MGRTALYRRNSQDRDERELGVNDQLKDGTDLCHRKGWPPPDPREYPAGDVFTDNNLSASRFAVKKRKKYGQLCRAIEAGEFERVVMAVEDRSHRQVLELAEFIQLCREHNVIPATPYTEYDLSDPDQVTIWFIKVRFAEAEVERTSRRVRRRRQQERESGVRHGGGRRAFGESGNGTHRVPAAKVAAERAELRAAGAKIEAGDSLRGVALDWNERGVLSAHGSKWTTPMLKRTLLAPRVAGLVAHDGEPVIGPDGKPVRLIGLDGEPVEPIIPLEQWEAIRTRLTDPARRTGNGGAPGVSTVGGVARYLLTGMCFCGKCGSRLVPEKSHGLFVYRCPDRAWGGQRCVQRDGERLEKLIEGALFEAVESPEWDQAAAQEQADDDTTRELYERLARDQALLDRADDALTLAELEGDKRKAASVRRVQAETEQRMERTRAMLRRRQGSRVLAEVPRNLRQVWPDLSLDRRRAILAAVLKLPPEGKGIVIHPQGRSRVFDPDTIVPDWRA
jgi:DNA invertase Pin-like site-specific DNA recombinase